MPLVANGAVSGVSGYVYSVVKDDSLGVVRESLNAFHEPSIAAMRSSADAPSRLSGKWKPRRLSPSLRSPRIVMVPARIWVVRNPEPNRPMGSALDARSSFDDPW